MSTETHEITISNITIDVVRKDIKNLHLAVYPPTGRVRIATPLRVNDEAVRLFAISKLSWIKKHQKNFGGQVRESVREYVSGESHYYNGKRYLLNVKQTDSVPKVVVGHRYIDLYVRSNFARKERALVLTRWYRKQLKEQIPFIIKKWEQKMGVKVTEFGVKQMKTKWGTCNIEAKRIWVNLELAKKPTHCLEYIIVHEMVHLLERHHNDRFIAHINKFIPNWKQYRDELNRLPISHTDWEY